MPDTTYRLLDVSNRRAPTLTEPAYCSISAILKVDCGEYPYAVYTEFACLRLAQTFHVPVADGVLIATDGEIAYASIEAGAPGLILPPLVKRQSPELAAAYPDQAAALVAYDIFIGNRDRAYNVKAATEAPRMQTFFAFDNSAALLGLEEDPLESIDLLASLEPLAQFHPFFGCVARDLLNKWVDRISGTPDELIRECCCYPGIFPNVSSDLQNKLAAALITRKGNLRAIVTAHMSTIGAK